MFIIWKIKNIYLFSYDINIALKIGSKGRRWVQAGLTDPPNVKSAFIPKPIFNFNLNYFIKKFPFYHFLTI